MDYKMLKTVLTKALLYRMMANLDRLIYESELSDQKLTERMGGKSHTWLNNAKNNAEDIRISSLIRVLAEIQDEFKSSSGKDPLDKRQVSSLFDSTMLEIAKIINECKDGTSLNVEGLFSDRLNTYKDLKGDWGILKVKKKLSPEELSLIEELTIIVQDKE